MKNGKATFKAAGTMMACATAIALALSGPVLAEEAAKPAPTDQHFEIHDSADSPPVNYRSNEDERYDTPEQRDAEMFAEQYEKEQAEKALKDKALLDGMGRASPNGDIKQQPGLTP
ncbi:MAG: hypothetical protein Q7T44_13665 [Parvibaculum sp.]|nr:hypothetical protein [Parvibaculum sp.]